VQVKFIEQAVPEKGFQPDLSQNAVFEGLKIICPNEFGSANTTTISRSLNVDANLFVHSTWITAYTRGAFLPLRQGASG
jgi:hypothetical protein